MARATIAASCVLICMLLGIGACSKTTTPASQAGIMVVVSTNLKASEYDEIRVQVSQQQTSGLWQSWLDESKLVPSEVTLPTTVFIEAGSSPDQEVDIRVTAYLMGNPVVLREAQLQAPTNRVATLYFVLAEVCKGQVEVTGAEGQPESTCPTGESCQPGTGMCGSNLINGTVLPTFVPGQGLDAGGDAGLFATPPLASDGGGAGDATAVDVSDAGTQAQSPDGGDASGMAEAGNASDAGSCPCSVGSLQCSGSTPQQCVSCAWQSQTACSGSTPVCSNGICGTFRATGGIRSTAPVPSGDAGIHLVAGGFERGTRTCVDGGVCVTGGIVP
jgi:hypothetical protein